MIVSSSEYIPTSEDYNFIYQLFEKDGNPLPGMELFFKNWFYWNDDLTLNGKPLSQTSIQGFIDSGCVNPPIINFKNEQFWSFIYAKDKQFVGKLYQYFKPKGFDIMDELSKFIAYSYNQNPYMIWCLFPIYISCLNKKQLGHTPSADNLFAILNWLSNNKKKYSCNAFLELTSYAAKHHKHYDVKKLIELFAKFTESQKSIPKNQIKKYEALLHTLENLAKEHCNTIFDNTPELKRRLNNTTASNYDIYENISRRWTFDVHNLSVKNGGFNVKLMKDNFDRLYESVRDYFNNQTEVHLLNYKNNDAIIVINLLVDHSEKGKEQIEKLQKLIDVIYGHCVRSKTIFLDELKDLWNTLLLAQGLEKSLVRNEKNIRKVVKI
jgi:hypothetical protein